MNCSGIPRYNTKQCVILHENRERTYFVQYHELFREVSRNPHYTLFPFQQCSLLVQYPFRYLQQILSFSMLCIYIQYSYCILLFTFGHYAVNVQYTRTQLQATAELVFALHKICLDLNCLIICNSRVVFISGDFLKGTVLRNYECFNPVSEILQGILYYTVQLINKKLKVYERTRIKD